MIQQVNDCCDEDMLKCFTNPGNVTFKNSGICEIIPIKMFYNVKDNIKNKNGSGKKRSIFVSYQNNEFEFKEHNCGLYTQIM